MTNAEIAKVMSQIATMLEMDGANTFRVRAYRECARVVEHLPEPAATLALTEGRLREIRGIGKDLEQKIRDLVTTGHMQTFDELRAKYPPVLVELTELPGLGPKRVKTLWESLKLGSRDALLEAARAGRIRALPGFGETVENNIIKSLEAMAAAPSEPGRMLLSRAWNTAHELAAAIRAVPGVERVEIAGSFRRRRETIGDLDLLVCGGGAEAVMGAFTSHGYVGQVLGRGDTKSSVKLGNGLQVDLRLVPTESFGAAMLYFTGSKQHNVELRKLALERGMSLNEYALTRGETVVAGRTEEEVYRALGLAFIPPELREAHGEIAQARDGTLPKLVELSDLRADLHMHTDRSDGRETLTGMVRAARDRGYAYCAITDHSKALGMARGFDDARVFQSVEELKAARREVPGIEVLHGLEVDILADGALDLGDDALRALDWVIVSLHSSLAQPREVITARVLRALQHPAVCLMGHPSGRKIGAREPAALDWERVFETAAEHGVAMEINAQPDRMDLSDVNARLARQRGLRFTIDTDAHAFAELDNMRYGMFMARRAGLTAADVMNTRDFAAFETWRKARRTSPRLAVATPTPAAKSKPSAKSPPEEPARAQAPAAARAKPAAATKAKPVAKAPARERGGAPPKPSASAKRGTPAKGRSSTPSGRAPKARGRGRA